MIALLATLFLAQVLPGAIVPPPPPTPVPSPSASPWPTLPPTAPQPFSVVDLEAGGGNAWLNDNRGRWEDAYLRGSYATPSGFRVYAGAENAVRFGSSQDVYAIGTDIPTNRPHGVLDVGYAFSTQNDVLPQSAWYADYNLRTGGGWGYQAGYLGRSFSNGDAGNIGLGIDKAFGDQRLGYFVSFAKLSTRSAVGVTQGLRWSHYLPADTVTVTADGGRNVEATGRDKVAMHDVVDFNVDELHWLDAKTAIRLDAGYASITPHAYQRFVGVVGLRVRL